MAEPLLSAASPHLIIAFAWKSSEFLRQELEQGFCGLVSATMMPDDVSGDLLKTQNNLVQWNSAVWESESVPMRDNIFIAASGQACIVLPWSWLRQKFSEILASKDSLMEAL